MELELKTFQSPQTPFHRLQYRHLNPDAPFTLLFCYGAGGSSHSILRYDAFIKRHPSLSILCIERWAQPAENKDASTVSRSGPTLFSELTAITLELLDSLGIRRFSIAAHSAGVYQMLDLAAQCQNDDRVQSLFMLCAHIPERFTQSKMLALMPRIPTPLFDVITKLDSSPPRWLAKMFEGKAFEQDDKEVFVDTPDIRTRIDTYQPSPGEVAASNERRRLDYGATHCRLPGIDGDVLLAKYRELANLQNVHVEWYTCEADIFFGPASVERILTEVDAKEKVEVVVVENASHAAIWLREVVWEKILQRSTAP